MTAFVVPETAAAIGLAFLGGLCLLTLIVLVILKLWTPAGPYGLPATNRPEPHSMVHRDRPEPMRRSTEPGYDEATQRAFAIRRWQWFDEDWSWAD